MKLKHGFEAEWISHLPDLPNDQGADFDRATFTFQDFPTFKEAERYAKRVLPRSEIGSVIIREFTLDRYGFKDYGRESVEVS